MKDFPEFRQRLGAGYFSLDLPQRVDQGELARAQQLYANLRRQFEQSPVIDAPLASTDIIKTD